MFFFFPSWLRYLRARLYNVNKTEVCIKESRHSCLILCLPATRFGRAAVEESSAAPWGLQMSDISSGHKTDRLKLPQLLFGLRIYEQR